MSDKPRSPIFTAIDPGLSGAVARLEQGKLTILRDFKSLPDIARAVCLLGAGADIIAIEQVHAMPGEGVVSCFSFGKSTGVALGAAYLHPGIPVVEIAPQRWQNYFRNRFNIPKGKPFKEVTREIASQMFPAQADLFKRKKDHNSADAALLAIYAEDSGEKMGS